MLVNRLVPSSSDAPLPRRLAKRLGAGAGAGAVCVAVALVLPLGGFLSEEIDSVRELNKWLLVAPLVAVGVAVVAAAALYRSSVRRYLWSGVLVGVGLEMFLFFLGLIGETLSREPFQRPGGGHLGLVGAGLLVACGTLALRGHEPATAVAPEEAPPAAVATP